MNRELEDLVNQFDNTLNLSSNLRQSSNMQNASNASQAPQVNYTLLKLFIDTIPLYDGNSITLNSFLSAGDFLFSTYGQPNDNVLRNYLLRTIRMKLTDNPQILVGSRNELDTWNKLKTALSDCFGDRRNLECLEQDLFMATPHKSESSLEFAKRIQVLRSTLAQKINSLPTNVMDQPTKVIYLRQYDTLCLRTFIRSLPGFLQSIIRLKNPDCIETAMNYIIEEENFQYTQNLFKNPVQDKSAFHNKPQHKSYYPPVNPSMSSYNRNYQPNASHMQRHPIPNHFNQNLTYNRFSQPNMFNNQPSFPNYGNKPAFPRGPINIQPRPIQNQHFPTNRQVFGPPQDVFKPTGKIPVEKPEPMSTRSRYTMPPLSSRNNHFRPNGPRNFVSQELYHLEENPQEIDEFAFPQIDYSCEDEQIQNHNMHQHFNNEEVHEKAKTN